MPLVTKQFCDLLIANKAASDVIGLEREEQEQNLTSIPLAKTPIFRLKDQTASNSDPSAG